MKKIIIVFLLIAIAAGMLAPSASAAQLGVLSYSVSSLRVDLTKDGTGSFNITVANPEVDEYAGVQYKVLLPADVDISVSYSNPKILSPMAPQRDSDGFMYFSTGFATSNNYTESLTCTVNVTYKGSTEAAIVIEEIKQSILSGHFANSYISDKTTTITLVPGDKEPDENGQNNRNPGTGSTGTTTTDDLEDPDLPFSDTFPFADVEEGDWFYGNVFYMWKNNLMNGTADDLFSPHATLTRGMVVTVLHRIEGRPDIAGLDNPFSDVAAERYYTDAVVWAADKKIVLGYSEDKFGPDDNVTREQLATMLHRYETTVDKIPENKVDANTFVDEDSISGYAKDAVSALVMQGIITGRPGNMFDPKGNATRAEFAAMLHRYLVADTIETQEE